MQQNGTEKRLVAEKIVFRKWSYIGRKSVFVVNGKFFRLVKRQSFDGKICPS